ncbi:dermonecrotic toxin domain-containing protein [Pseudomonas fluorescens]|uniref:dermonecrotic toxin domain-containing protein n=1 Tax=Pseudomonas fluorescens TaxID=294 RepID=UPI00398FADEE
MRAAKPYGLRTSVKTAFVMAAFLQENEGSLSLEGLQLALLSAGLGDNQIKFDFINNAQLEHSTRPMDEVDTFRLMLYRYTAQDLWVFRHRSSGLTLLYIPGNSSPLHEFADLKALKSWVVQQARDPLKKVALVAHFSKDDREDGTFHAGVLTALDGMAIYPLQHHLTRNAGFFNDDGYWDPASYINLAGEPRTIDPFAELVMVMKQASLATAEEIIRDDADVNRANLSAVVEPTVRWLNQWGALALFFPGGEGLLALAGLIEAAYGINEIVDAEDPEHRKEGLTRTVFGLLNALPLAFEVGGGKPDINVPSPGEKLPEPVIVEPAPIDPGPGVSPAPGGSVDLPLAEWSRPRLMRCIGPSVESFSEETLEQVRKVSGIDDNGLRLLHAEHRAPRGILADTISRFKIDQDLQTLIERLSSGQHAQVDSTLVQWLTRDKDWPADVGLRLMDKERIVWEFRGRASVRPIVVQQGDGLLQAVVRRLDTEEMRALLADQLSAKSLLPDLDTRVQLLRKKLGSIAQRQRTDLFKQRYLALQKTDSELLLTLRQEHPDLPNAVLEQMLIRENLTASQNLTLEETKQLMLRLETRAQEYERSVRLARAYEGLFLDSVSNVDSDTLLLHTVERMPGWTRNVCIEVREGSFNGNVLDRIGAKGAPQWRCLVKMGNRYQAFDTFGQPAHAAENFADAVLHALPDTELAALRLHADDGLLNFKFKIRQQALPRQELATVLRRQELRSPFYDPDDGGLKGGGAPVPVSGEELTRVISRLSVKEFYPYFTDAQADEFLHRFGVGAVRELDRLKAEFERLETGLRDWEGQVEADMEAVDGLTLSEDELDEDLSDEELEAINDERIEEWLGTEREYRRTLATVLKKRFKWQGDESEKIYLDGQMVGFRLDLTRISPGRLYGLPTLGMRFSGVASLEISGECDGLVQFLEAFPELQTLELSRVSLNELPAAIMTMTGLRTLKIYNAELVLTPANAGSFSNLIHLRELSLDSNPLGRPPSVLGLSELQKLSLSDTRITSCPVGIAHTPYLKLLDLSGNQISRVPESVLQQSLLSETGKIPSGRNVILDFNPITDRDTLQRLIAHRRRTGIDLWRNSNAPDVQQPADWLQGLPEQQMKPRAALWARLAGDPKTAMFAERFKTLGQTPEYLVEREDLQRRVWEVLEGVARADERLQHHLISLAANGSKSPAVLLEEFEIAIRQYDAWKSMPQPSFMLPKRPRLE